MTEQWKEGTYGGMTPEQEKEFESKGSFEEAIEFYGKCKEENLTDEYKEYRKWAMANGTFGGIGGTFPKYYYVKENGKLIRKENNYDDI